MSLVNCSECGNQVSDRAPACPRCGAPRATQPAAPSGDPSLGSATASPPPKRKTHLVTWVVFFALIGVVFYYALQDRHQQELKPLPIRTEFRPALIGPGLVLMFENQSDQSMTFLATLERPATNVIKTMELYTGPHGHVSIGSREGWIGQHGDHIKLENIKYRIWTGEIP